MQGKALMRDAQLKGVEPTIETRSQNILDSATSVLNIHLFTWLLTSNFMAV